MVYAVAILLVSSLTSVGLLAIWAATSHAHWFWRTMFFLAAISPVLLIPAHEPFVAFVIQGAVVAGGVQLAKWRSARQRGESLFKSQFSLQTVLLAMVPLAVIVAVGVQIIGIKDFNWLGSVQIGFTAGMLSLTVLWIVKGKQPFRWRVIPGTLSAIVLTMLLQWKEWFLSEVVEFSFMHDYNSTDWQSLALRKDAAVGLTWLAVVMVTMVCMATVYFWASSPKSGRTSQKRLALVFGLLLIAPSAAALMLLIQKPPIPVQDLPDPNGYNDFLAAAQTLPLRVTVYSNNFNPDTDSLDVVRKAIEEVQPAIDHVRVGLSKEIQRPLDYSSLPTTDLNDASRKISAGLRTAGKLAEREGDYDNAAAEYVTLLQFATRYFRGSTITAFLVGGASSGCRELFSVRDALTSEVQLKLISQLAEIDRRIEPLEELVERDRCWSIYVYGWKEHLRQVIERFEWVESFMERIFPVIYRRDIACLRLLQAELALRVWKSDHGDWPKSLDKLVPNYLPAIPIDPFSNEGQPLRYLRKGEHYLLYSVGANGTDETGMPPELDAMGGGNLFTGDLRLDNEFATDDN